MTETRKRCTSCHGTRGKYRYPGHRFVPCLICAGHGEAIFDENGDRVRILTPAEARGER